MVASIAGVLLGFVVLLLIALYGLRLLTERVMRSKGVQDSVASVWLLVVGVILLALGVVVFLG